MAIVKMNKFTLFALESHKEALLDNLQKFEGVHFSNLQELVDDEISNLNPDKEDERISEYTQKISQINFAMNFLQEFIEPSKGFKSKLQGKQQISYEELKQYVDKSDWYQTYSLLRENDQKVSDIKGKITNLESEIVNLATWSNLTTSFSDLNNLKFCKSFLGTIPETYKDKLINDLSSINRYYFEEISKEANEINFLVIAYGEDKDEVYDILRKNYFSEINFTYNDSPKNIIRDLRKKIKELEKEQDDVLKQVSNYSKEITNLQYAYEYFSNELVKAKASDKFVKTDKVFVIQGYLPFTKKSDLEKIVKNNCKDNYYLEFETVEDDESVPILLENNAFIQPFESITEMYSLPTYKEIDPTPVLSIFYLVFFGMMLSDAGYGLMMVIGCAIALKILPLEKGQRNFAKLFLYLGISTTIWGAIYGGWFGDAPSTFFNASIPALINPANDIMKVLVISIIFGLVHMFVGLGMKAYVLVKNGKPKDAFYDVAFWYFTLIGAILMLLGIGGSTGKILLIIGVVGLFLTQGRDAPTIGGKIGGGINGIYGITGYFGDVVSYSRLMALGVATGFIANALNLIIKLIPAPASYILGPILFIALHAFNLAINGLGSYVHTSRLQYLEFFNKFYEGGGQKFTPFKRISKFIRIVNK